MGVSSLSTADRRPRAVPLPLQWLGLALLALGAWQLAAWLGLMSAAVVPKPTAVLAALPGLLANPGVQGALLQLLLTFLLAFGLGTGAGILVGALIGLSGFLHRILHPAVVLLYSTPKMIFIPLVILLFGVGGEAKVFYGFISALPPVLITVAGGIGAVNPRLLTVSRALGASRLQTILHVALPAALPSVFTGIWFGLQSSLLGVLVAELFTSQQGIGYYVTSYAASFRPDRVFALLLFVAALAVLLGSGWRRLERWMLRWRPTS